MGWCVNARKPSSGWPIVTALAIWFAHFMAIWATGEIVWPDQWAANAFAWGATVIALVAVGFHGLRLKARHANGSLSGWSYRLASGVVAIATAAVVFSALPSVLVLP